MVIDLCNLTADQLHFQPKKSYPHEPTCNIAVPCLSVIWVVIINEIQIQIQRSSGGRLTTCNHARPARPTLRSTSQGRVNNLHFSWLSKFLLFQPPTPLQVRTSHICRAHSTAFPTFPPTPFSHLRPPFPSRLGVRAGRREGKRLLISSGSTGEETNRAR